MIDTIVRRLKRDKLTFLNEFLGVPLGAIAKRLGVSQPYLSVVKAGNRKLSGRMQRKLDDMLSDTLDALDKADGIPHEADALLDAIIDYGESL